MQIDDLVRALATRRLLIVGDVILDEYVAGDSSRISAEAPVPVVHFTQSRSVLGGAANAAANIAALGGRATLLGLIGDDVAGQEIARACEVCGIHLLPVRDG